MFSSLAIRRRTRTPHLPDPNASHFEPPISMNSTMMIPKRTMCRSIVWRKKNIEGIPSITQCATKLVGMDLRHENYQGHEVSKYKIYGRHILLHLRIRQGALYALRAIRVTTFGLGLVALWVACWIFFFLFPDICIRCGPWMMIICLISGYYSQRSFPLPL